MKHTILGANGTIGSVLAKELRAFTTDIRLVSRQPKKVNPGDELLSADLSDTAQVEKAIAGSAVVYLLVGFEYSINVWKEKWPPLMKACIDGCSKHNAKLVFFDNVYPYDKSEIPHMTEDAKINPPSEKGKVRAQIAKMLMDAVAAGKLTGLIARSADFYGPDNERSFLNEVTYKNNIKGKKAQWFVNADKVHTFTFTPDAAKATALLGTAEDVWGQVWHLPTTKEKLTGKQWANLFAESLHAPKGVSVLPLWFIKFLGIFVPFMREMPEMMYQYTQDYVFDSSKFEKRFGLFATPAKEAVALTCAKK